MSTKKFIAAAAFAVVALFSGINAYNNSNEVQLSDLALANVEALASGEVEVVCSINPGKCWLINFDPFTGIIGCIRTDNPNNFCY